MKTSIGIDVGKQGGIAAIYPDGRIKFHKTPLVAKEIDLPTLKEIILQLVEDEGKGTGDVLIAIEAVQNLTQVGSKSNFQFGRALGMLEGLVTGLELPFLKIHPKKWQKYVFEGIPVVYVAGSAKTKVNKKTGEEYTSQKMDTKAMALLAAKRLFPNTSFKATDRSKVDHDGIVDALMMAKYIKDNH